jgi:hypothetical protein
LGEGEVDSAACSSVCASLVRANRKAHPLPPNSLVVWLGLSFGPESDVGVLVEFERSHTPGLFALGGMLVDLSDLAGREVDLRTPDDFPARLRERVLAGAQLLYAAE